MRKKRFLNLFVCAAVLSQTALSGTQSFFVRATSTQMIGNDQLTDNDTAAPVKDVALPSLYQYEYQKQELAAFSHFGPNTFNEIEWGESYGTRTPNDIFRLTKDFDADSFVKGIKEAGFKKLIVTAKHHDGFCIWNSEHTTYDMGSVTNYKNGQGDILAEISAACSKYDVDMGLYLSPWDIHDKSYGYRDAQGNALVEEITVNGKKEVRPKNGQTWEYVKANDADGDYNEFYNNTLQEILGNDKYGNKGHFKEIWMDGAKGSGANAQVYDFQKWFKTIQDNEGKAAGYADDIQIFGAEAYTGVRWIGNELGFAADETWSKSRINLEENTIDSRHEGGYSKGYANGNKWTVPESDARITSGWFWGNTKKTPKSIPALAEMYFRSVGHNSPLLLNIPPNSEGKIDVAIMNRLLEFGDQIKQTFANNLAVGATVVASEVRGNDLTYSPQNLLDGSDETYWTVNDQTNSASIVLRLPQTTKFDVVSIEEAIQFGQRIGSYTIEYRKNGETNWTEFDRGKTIGAKRLARNKPVEADEVKISVTTHSDAEHPTPILTKVGLFKATKKFEMSTGVPEGFKLIDNTQFEKPSGWYDDANSPNFINNTAMWTNGADKYATATFTGTKAYLIGTIDRPHGVADIYVDNQLVKRIDTHGPSRKLRQILFETDTLPYGQHTVKIVNKGSGDRRAIGVDALIYLDNRDKGAFQIEYGNYNVSEGKEIPIKIKRIGGTTGAADVDFQVNPGSAWQDHFDANGNMTVHFEEGQTEAFAKVTTKRVPNTTGTLTFTAELVNATNGVLIGLNSPAEINIFDTEEMTPDILKASIDEASAINAINYTEKTYQLLKTHLAKAKRVYQKPNANQTLIADAWSDLTSAMRSLQPRTTYTTSDPFVMPSIQGMRKTIEAEHALLDGSLADANKYVRVESDATASNHKKVGWFEPRNKITIPFYAEKPGTYTMRVTFQTGRTESNPNELLLTSPIFSNPVSRIVFADSTGTTNPGYQTVEFDIVLNGDGPITSEFVFEANAKGSPNLDKVEVTAKEVSMNHYTIEASSVGEGALSETGTIEVVEGANKQFTFTPNEGFTVKDVIVDGESIGPRLNHTFNEITENHTIVVEFVRNDINEENRFEFPTKGNTAFLEAERLVLNNTGDVNEAWKLSIQNRDWASMGKVIDSMNGSDTLLLHYHAQEVGVYDVTLQYRSGSSENNIAWSEANGNILEQRVVAGHNHSNVTKTKRFTIEVLKAGPGVITFTTNNRNAPIIDYFAITNNQQEVPLNVVALEKAITDSDAIDLALYVDGADKETFKATLAEAKVVLENANAKNATQTQIDEITTRLNTQRTYLRQIEIKPMIDKTNLKNVIDQAENIGLEKYEDNVQKEAFRNALMQAKAVLNNDRATKEEVDEAVTKLTEIKNQLVLKSKDKPQQPKPQEKPPVVPPVENEKPKIPQMNTEKPPVENEKPKVPQVNTENPAQPKEQPKEESKQVQTITADEQQQSSSKQNDYTVLIVVATVFVVGGAVIAMLLKGKQ